jgi:hypothetical protein
VSQQVKGRRGRGIDKAWAQRMQLLRAVDTLADDTAHRRGRVFAADDPTTGKLYGRVEGQRAAQGVAPTNSLADAAAAKEEVKVACIS